MPPPKGDFRMLSGLSCQDQPPTLQLFDMGMVHVLPEPVVEASARELYALGMGGTMHWIPPETWAGRSGACSDLWGVGLVVHVLLLRQLPFGLQHCEGRVAVWDAIRTGAVASSNANVSKEAMYILGQLLEKEKFAYKSEVRYDQNKGDLDMQIYLPTDVGTIKVSLYDHHEVLSHDLVGTSTFNPATDCGAEDVCSFTLKFRSTETVVEEVARLQGRWIRGGALRAHAEECNKRGTFVHFEEETREKSTYKLYSVKAEGIENELFYARNGSVFPASLHGVHWMDQRGTSLRKRGKYEEEPDYKQVCALSAEEVFMHFGEAAWNPKTKCATGVRQYAAMGGFAAPAMRAATAHD
eukprot:g23259.t1